MDTELTEPQFELLKSLCEGGVALIIFDNIPKQSEDPKFTEEFNEFKSNIDALTRAGFLENHADDIKEQANSQGLFDYTAVVLSEQAVRMFGYCGKKLEE